MLVMQWENGSAPVGEVRQFVRFQKYHYYEKTAEGCVEITAAEYAARKGIDVYADYRQAGARLDAFAYDDESTEERDNRNSGVNGNDGNAGFVSRQAIGEELRNEAGGSLRGSNRNITGISDGISEAFNYGTDRETETFDSWSADIQSGNGRNNRNSVGFENSGTAGRVDVLDGGSSGSDAVGYSWENYGYSSHEGLIEAVKSGAMVMEDIVHVINNFREKNERRKNKIFKKPS